MMEVNIMTRINPLTVALKKKQAMEAQNNKVVETKEVATEAINSDYEELRKHRYCGIRPGSKMPDCKWTTQSIDWDQAQTKSDLAIIIPDDYIVVDIDDETEGKALLKLVEANSEEYGTVISCVMRTDHGYHFWFRKPDTSLDTIGIKHTSRVKTLLTLSVDYRLGGKGYMVIRRGDKDREWVHGSWSDLSNVATIPNILYPIAPTDDRHKALYQAKTAKYGYQILPDGRLGSYCGLPKGQRTMALLSYYGYLKTMYTDILPRDINDCKMVIYNINKYLLEEPIPDDELFCEVLNNTERVAVTSDNSDNSGNNTTREQDDNQDGGRDIISLSLHGHTTNPNQEDTTHTNSTTTPTRAINSNNNNNTSYADMARDIIEGYNVLYYHGNYYIYHNGVYEPLSGNCKDSELMIHSMILSAYPGLALKHRREILDDIKILTLVTKSDDDGDLLAMDNGVYNVATHTFEHWDDIEMGRYHFFKRIPITYKNAITINKTITDFEIYRSSLFPENKAEDYKKVLDQIFGYTFYRHLTAQKLFFFWGPGGTGKSTYANFLARMIGVDNTRHKTLNQLVDNKYATNDLRNIMLNVGDETITAKSLTSVDLLKCLAVEGQIETEAKYRDAQSVQLFAKNIFCTNDRPKTQDLAFWDRVLVIPFNNVFRNTDKGISDDRLRYLLDNEDVKSYMFSLAMEALKELKANNWQFAITPDMATTKEAFMPSVDPINDWLQDAGIDDDNIIGRSTQEVRDSYKQWCTANRYRPMGIQQFTQYVKDVFSVTIGRRQQPDGKKVRCYRATEE
jgi:putative DNA primase/helicase